MKHFDNNGRRSRAVLANGVLYMGGQVADDWSADAAEQTRQALARIDALLAEAGGDRSAVVSATIWLKSMDDYKAMNAVWDGWVNRDAAPARACGVVEMADPRILVEIIPTAVLQ
ncbi:RidA family protein [Citreicella sp. C3M06]|uniref:RidA family protein n=1 Tax=Roseobacteraceae TaxID=2854170 RepID=UPI001C088F4D|nr:MULTISPECIES: RidA family protein [Roseobacteraceae]MBU2961652.1 RidA family protein [Citreicella sp. C3M06]MDO6587413.1 RidA family protein [Salipiger sp. 1_MG-2023]